jgi:hypothetical protein
MATPLTFTGTDLACLLEAHAKFTDRTYSVDPAKNVVMRAARASFNDKFESVGMRRVSDGAVFICMTNNKPTGVQYVVGNDGVAYRLKTAAEIAHMNNAAMTCASYIMAMYGSKPILFPPRLE